ncbi:hypothetical protein HPB51_020728 [Rhipicephalus microplus]|uniref:Uncharacterized protein n=1 Tax=Rhipicephalus microplus TaxID=6941 RepID=A0A9J6E3R8_RHIMP|nr:hypothetical protein HPB51_020728 [Rhipicephalus microplus]
MNSAVVSTALYHPSATGGSFRGSPRLPLAVALAGWSGVEAVRVNHRRNIVAADVASPECLRELFTKAQLNRIPVTTKEPADRRVSTGFVYGGAVTLPTQSCSEASSQPFLAGSAVASATLPRHASAPATSFAAALRPTHGGQPLQTSLCERRWGSLRNKSPLTKVQKEWKVASLMATAPTLLSSCAVRGVVCEESPEVQSYAATLKASPLSRSKAPAQPRTSPAARQLNQPAAHSTEVELPAAQPVKPIEDERDAHIRILVTALQYVLDYPRQPCAGTLHSCRQSATWCTSA